MDAAELFGGLLFIYVIGGATAFCMYAFFRGINI